MRGQGSGGFTLLEVVVALTMAGIVLVGIGAISSQMIRFMVESARKSTVVGWSLISIGRMNKEIELASVLAYPTNGSGSQDMLVGCDNWSYLANNGAGGRLNTNTWPTGAANVKVFYYCYDSIALTLRRMANIGTGVVCPASPPPLPSCSAGGGYTENDVIATSVYRNPMGTNTPIFERSNDVGGVRIRYIVGDPNVTAKMPNPQKMSFDFKLPMNKQYNNATD